MPPTAETIRAVAGVYVFETGPATADLIPPGSRRMLSPIDAERAREVRADLLSRLNR